VLKHSSIAAADALAGPEWQLVDKRQDIPKTVVVRGQGFVGPLVEDVLDAVAGVVVAAGERRRGPLARSSHQL